MCLFVPKILITRVLAIPGKLTYLEVLVAVAVRGYDWLYGRTQHPSACGGPPLSSVMGADASKE